MSAPTLTENPFVAPQTEPDYVSSSRDIKSVKSGSFAIVSLGFVLLLGGYFVSNFFMISDLYQVGFGPNGEVIPSPFAANFHTPFQQWMLYGVSALATIAGLVMIGSQRFNSIVAVCYIMCPLVAIAYLVGWPLRTVQTAVAVVAVYIAFGSCLTAVGIMRLVDLYGQPSGASGAFTGSMMTQAGLALALGALLKLWRSESPNSATGPDD